MKQKLLNDKPVIVLMLLSLIGLFLSVFLAYEYSKPTPITCFQATNDCEVVRNSDYARILGISVPYWGMAYFIFVFGYLYSIKAFDLHEKHHYSLIVPMGLAFIFESYLTYIQVMVIEAICTWCLLIEVVVTVMFILYLLYLNKPQKFVESERADVTSAPLPD